MRLLSLLTLALALGLASASPADAQRVPVDGDWSISAQLFNSDLGTIFGLWHMFTDRINAGIEAEIRSGESSEELDAQVVTRGVATTDLFTIGPSIKLYGMRGGPVSPYLRAKVQMGWERRKLTQNEDLLRDEDFAVKQGSVSLGAEWYPIRALGIGFHTGLQYLRSNGTIVDNLGNLTRERESTTYGTFRSGLEVHFFFR